MALVPTNSVLVAYQASLKDTIVVHDLEIVQGTLTESEAARQVEAVAQGALDVAVALCRAQLPADDEVRIGRCPRPFHGPYAPA